MNNSLELRRAGLFLLATYALTTAYCIAFSQGINTDLLTRVVLEGIPLLSVLLVRLVTKEREQGAIWLAGGGKFSMYVAAYYLPMLCFALGTVLYFLLFPAHYDPGAGYLRQLAQETGSAFVPLGRRLGLALLPLAAIFDILLLYVEMMPFYGYLFPKLLKRFSPLTAALLTGVLHGIWYIPFGLTRFQGNDPGALQSLLNSVAHTPVEGSVLFYVLEFPLVFGVLGMGIGYAVCKTRGSLIAAVSLAGFTGLAQLGMYFMAADAQISNIAYFIFYWAFVLAGCAWCGRRLVREGRAGTLVLPPKEKAASLQEQEALQVE